MFCLEITRTDLDGQYVYADSQLAKEETVLFAKIRKRTNLHLSMSSMSLKPMDARLYSLLLMKVQLYGAQTIITLFWVSLLFNRLTKYLLKDCNSCFFGLIGRDIKQSVFVSTNGVGDKSNYCPCSTGLSILWMLFDNSFRCPDF